MPLLIVAFLAGVLTIAAPCVLPVIPVIIGGSLTGGVDTFRWRPVIIAVSFGLSIVVFTLLLKATTTFLSIPQLFWQLLSGSIIVLFGLHYLWPGLWQVLSAKFGLQAESQSYLAAAKRKPGFWGAVLTGAALGPVFNSCSPTYALIVAAVLPVSLAEGSLLVMAYAVGLSVSLLLVSLFGISISSRLAWLASTDGVFHKVLGVAFILVGASLVFGLDKHLQVYILDQGWYAPVSDLELRLRGL